MPPPLDGSKQGHNTDAKAKPDASFRKFLPSEADAEIEANGRKEVLENRQTQSEHILEDTTRPG